MFIHESNERLKREHIHTNVNVKSTSKYQHPESFNYKWRELVEGNIEKIDLERELFWTREISE